MCWHKWSKWELFEFEIYNTAIKDKEGNIIKGVGRRQRKHCLKCGYTREELLPRWED